ncbi:MAG TPA: LysE family translocator [Alphaproteobacteria bacterium]|nr:LysE family translocator [Alphaproteobacteria bacterium]
MGLMHGTLGSLVLFAAVMSFTPGPNIVMVTASAANFGFGRTIPQMIGITLGFGFMVVVAGLGLAGVVQAEPRLHKMLRYAGGAYLLYLAWCIARADSGNSSSGRGKPIGFFEGALFTWLNPKAWVMALGALAAFTTTGGDVLLETSVIASVLTAACFASVMIWAGFGAAIGRLLGNPRARIAFNWSMAGLLVLSLLPVLR